VEPLTSVFEQEHLTPEAIAKMAAAAHVKTVVLTHFTPDGDNVDISWFPASG
jgi:ribonuclease BN (tRNA processing enzyme)